MKEMKTAEMPIRKNTFADNLDWSTLLSETANLHFCMDNASMVSPSPSTVSRLSSMKTENDPTKMANLSLLVSVDPTWRKGKEMMKKGLHVKKELHLSIYYI